MVSLWQNELSCLFHFYVVCHEFVCFMAIMCYSSSNQKNDLEMMFMSVSNFFSFPLTSALTVQFRLMVTSFFCTNQGNEQCTTGFCFANRVTINFETAMLGFHFYTCTSEYHLSSAAWVLNMQHRTTEGIQWCPLHCFSMQKQPCLEGRYLGRKEKGDVSPEN
jgi:hypothetical protein